MGTCQVLHNNRVKVWAHFSIVLAPTLPSYHVTAIKKYKIKEETEKKYISCYFVVRLYIYYFYFLSNQTLTRCYGEGVLNDHKKESCC